MKNTPRYIRLLSVALSLTAWQVALGYRKFALTAYLDGYSDSLGLYETLMNLSTALTLVVLVNVIWVIMPQEKRAN